MMNKLQYDTPRAAEGAVNVWNERPRDVANLARWTGRQLEHDLNWQIVNMEVSPEALHDAPILYISGSQQLAYSAKKIEKFREFVEQGGMIFGNADCGKPEFVKSFIRLGNDLFPAYEFRQLPPNHPIYTREQYKASEWRNRPNVMGLTNGVRELMILVPEADPSRLANPYVHDKGRTLPARRQYLPVCDRQEEPADQGPDVRCRRRSEDQGDEKG